MKSLLIFTFFVFCSDQNWIDEAKILVLKIEKNASFTKSKFKSDRVIKKLKFGKYKKYTIESNKDSWLEEFFVGYYVNRNFIFCQKINLKVRILHKGVRTEKDPIGELSETVIYFQTELNGIKLTKSVNWFEKSNLDSLRSVLNRLDSDTSNIGKKDYDLIKKGFNRLRRQ